MDWDDLRITLAVVRHGSLSAAARALGTTQPTISRRLDGFERSIGVKLFERNAEGLSPTPLCLALVDGLNRMDEGALTIERRIAGRDTGLQGAITVTSLDWLGDEVVAPILARFGRRHKLVSLELLNEGRLFNLSRREADIAFRFKPFEQENLVERKVVDIAYGLYVSPAYLRRQGLPDFSSGCASDLVATLHDAAGPVIQGEWLRTIAPAAHVVLRSNSTDSQLAAVEAGEAMAVLPRALGDSRPNTLERIEPPLPEPVRPLLLGFHADLRDTPRIRALIDFAVDELNTRAKELNPHAVKNH